ncbi:MAG: hypothetical protein AAF585_13425 [Verrucomicrobiota bacterium]
MPTPPKALANVTLTEIGWTSKGQVQKKKNPKKFVVQFNPESLKLVYSSEKAGGDQAGGSAIQYVGQGTTKLSMDLIFDASRDSRSIIEDKEKKKNDPKYTPKPDVRNLTQQIIDYIKPKDKVPPSKKKKKSKTKPKFIPPGLQVQWGSFMFHGVVDSISETLDFWSEDGRPLQAKIMLSMSRQEINVNPATLKDKVSGASVGATPRKVVRSKDTASDIAAREGEEDWQNMAAGNGIENPRDLPEGMLLDPEASAADGDGFGFGDPSFDLDDVESPFSAGAAALHTRVSTQKISSNLSARLTARATPSKAEAKFKFNLSS